MIQSVREVDPVVLMMETLERQISEKTGGAILDLRVEMLDEQIVLSGRTSRYYNKQLATKAVRELLHEDQLLNQIEVG